MVAIPKQSILAALVIMTVVQFAAACDERCTVSDPCEASSSLKAIDADEFNHVPAFEATNYEGITPLMQFDHWQLRQQIAGPDWAVLAQGGDRDFSELSDAERQQLVNAPVVDGFTLDCQPGTCKRHFISLVRDSVKVWARPADAIKFLGTIETQTEAVLVARAHGFAFSATDKRLGGVLRIGDDFLLLAFKTTSTCNPIATTRYLLRIIQDATLSELGSGVTSRRDGCFVI
jgi:hypothetical protein